MSADLIVLSYHQFTEKEDEYPFSRTYEQFWHDIRKKEYDLITIDDGRKDMIKACRMMSDLGIKAKLFICTSLVGKKDYCTWKDLRQLSKKHEIGNHSHFHKLHPNYDYQWQKKSIYAAQRQIGARLSVRPTFFVPPYNTFDENTEAICNGLGLILLKDRITIKNDSK